MHVEHVASFSACSLGMKFEVTIEATTAHTNVAYMRNLDPDNDIMRVTGASGSYGATGGITYTTRNCILGQKKQGDAFTGVSATSVVGTDSFFGMFSWDERSAVAHGGFHNYNPYNTAFDDGEGQLP
jgi:hypothetical protein